MSSTAWPERALVQVRKQCSMAIGRRDQVHEHGVDWVINLKEEGGMRNGAVAATQERLRVSASSQVIATYRVQCVAVEARFPNSRVARSQVSEPSAGQEPTGPRQIRRGMRDVVVLLLKWHKFEAPCTI